MVFASGGAVSVIGHFPSQSAVSGTSFLMHEWFLKTVTNLAYCILRKMRKLRIGCVVLVSPMRNICARLYFFPKCAVYVQDSRKIVLISPMRKIVLNF